MIAKKGEFYSGLGLLAGFLIVLVLMFLPIINGQNFLNYMDDLYNSISKDSAYYIPKIKTEITDYQGVTIDLALEMNSERVAKQSALLLTKSGAQVQTEGPRIHVSGDLGAILTNCLNDADAMFHNRGDQVAAKYGYDAKQVLYNWYLTAIQMDKELKHQKRFQEATMVATVQAKAVECAYNYYGIVPESIKNKAGIVFVSLLFYVIYTLWFGFSIMFLFEGWGMQLEH